MQKNYNKKRKLNKLKASLLLLMMVLFAGAAQAQVYMHSGTQNVSGNLSFYDSGGASSNNGTYYWEKWYQHNENSTLTFKNGTNPIQVTFGLFHAWDDDAAGTGVVDLGQFSLRVNNDHLYVYDGENADPDKLICDLTGTLVEPFTLTTNGPITFKFVSDGQYRDEGWAATVSSPNTYTVQAPIITKETCSDYVILYNTANGATLYYSTDGNDPDPFDPLSEANVYNASFPIDLDDDDASVLVRAIAVLDGMPHSAVAEREFTHDDQRPTPDAPAINISGNTVTFVPDEVPAGLNETYNIRYTTDESDPSATHGTLLTKSTGFSIEWHTPNTVFKAVTVAVTCSDKVSEVTSEPFGNVTVPTPTITFGSDGKATITCSLDGATIYYTTDGSTPTATHYTGTGTTPVTTAALPIGTTVYALATYGTTGSGYDNSSIASAIYVPAGGNNIYGDVVFLDDREDHNWSYYSKGGTDNPVHSLNPADIKITYYGYGDNTMTTTDTDDVPSTFDGDVDADDVAVGPNDPGNQFIYLKTLENANTEGTGNYPYTMIPNPFSKRPTYVASTRGEGNGTLRGNNEMTSSRTITETFNDVTATGYDGNVNLPEGWHSDCSNSNNAYPPHVSNYANYSYISNYDGNYLLFTASRGAYAYACAPKYENSNEVIASISFRYRYESTSYGTLTVGYVTNNNNFNTFTSLQTLNATTTWTQVNLSSANIATINNNGGYLAFRFTKSNRTVYSAAIDNVVVSVGTLHNVNIASGITGGTVTASPTQAVEGATVTLTITPNGNNTINSVTVTGVETGDTYTVSGTGNTRTFSMPDEDVIVNASFNDALAITVISGSGGSVTSNPSGSAVPGTQVTLTISMNTGVTLTSITVKGNSTQQTITLNGTGNTRTFTMPNESVEVRAIFNDPNAKYRGFYAWRVKRLNGVTIQRADGTTVGVNGTIGADEHIEFVTSNAKGNEVDFEALWAQAYVVESNTATGLHANVSYERNFVVGAGASNINVPVTYSSNYPDGTPSGRTASGNAFTCGADTKFENYTFTGGTNSTLNTGGHKLIVGRDVTCSGNVSITPLSGTFNAAANAVLRIESGTYNGNGGGTINLYGNPSVGNNLVHLDLILGSDYDRANKGDNSHLSIANNTRIQHGAHTATGSSWYDFQHLDIVVKSGRIQQNLWTASSADWENTFYCRSTLSNASYYPGFTYLTVEGGEFASINGGRGNYQPNLVDPDAVVFSLRIKGGTVHGSIYGAASANPSWGGRRIVITKGMVEGWIAAGCDGTSSGGGPTIGEAYIYVGGNAQVGNSENPRTLDGTVGGNIFGAGRGMSNHGTNSNPASMRNSYIVVADNGSVLHNVYGGGEYGYTGCSSSDGGTDPETSANIYVLGGSVQGDVFGGGNRTKGTNTNIYMKGGTVEGSLYGGSNNEGTIENLATINMSGGTVTDVFGGGYGSDTKMAGGTNVTVSGGTINNNVYGGGEEGEVTAVGTTVTFKGGTVNDIYGAGKGTDDERANIAGSTAVSVEGGTVNGSVYGGGQNGTVAYNSDGANNTSYNSTVGVKGGEVKGNVYGGGKLGTSQVATFVNISDGIIRGHVFGGAEGRQKSVFVTGQRTVNMTGGHVYGNVYGGSQNANDGNDLDLTDASFANSQETSTMCVTNISGGIIDENVYAAGFFGNCFGSVYVFIGKDAIENAPYNSHITTPSDYYKVAPLSITGTVWAGGDWGTFSGTFGNGTISGNSNVYVDGNGYETTTQQVTNAQYMNIGGAILGCGTSCHAGKKERTVIIRNYGTAAGSQPTEASRTLLSIQFAKVLIFDNSNLNLTGQGCANKLDQTEKYSIYESYDETKSTNLDTDVDGVRIVNGSGLFLNAPVTQIANFRSMSCPDVEVQGVVVAGVYASTTPTLTGYTAITPSTLSSCNNQVRVNGGNYIEIKWGSKFGALIGYAHMMASTSDSEGTCAYARPRWETKAPFNMNDANYDNRNDGGWVSYTNTENTYALDGTNPGTDTNPAVQMAYENHTVRNGEGYFRIWRVGGTEHYREGIFNANAKGNDTWKTFDVVITLPAFRDPANYYCFETNGDATTIDYGADVLMWNAARENGTGDDWMYYDEDNDQQMSEQEQSAVDGTLDKMKDNPDVNFGLVILPSTGLAGSDYIICYEADNNLALPTTKFTKADNTVEPQVRFRLTYYDKLTSNMTWDPSNIVLVQKDASGNVVDKVTISLAVSTSSTIEQEFSTKLYAIMQGKGSTSETFNAKVVLPSFAANLYSTGTPANFKLNSVDFETAHGGELIARGGSYDLNKYAVGYAAGFNYDNTDGWNGEGIYTEQDAKPMTANNPTATSIGKTGGRTVFAIDFTLHYNGSLTVTTEELIGTLTFNFTFDNYKGIDAQGNEYEITNQPLKIIVEVYRRGQGTAFYLDGINGSNANDARHPDKAVVQLSTIFNRCGYMAGDEIYIVNQITANKQLSWNGLPYSNVTIYRYNGGHELSAADASIIGNADNTAYLGNLLNVTNHMTMTGITLDGYYNNGEATYIAPDPVTGEDTEYSTDRNGGPHTVTAQAPMVTIAQGGTLELSQGTVLQGNNSSSMNGAAVNVADGGKLMMNKDATIKDNVTSGNGGGVYMAGTMVVSDDIQIVNNKKGTTQNNVFLASADKTITIGTTSGTDAYGALSANAKIGVTKAVADDYTSVVNVDEQVDVEWLETPYNTHPNSIIYHDGGKYQLVKYTDPKILYWVGTWVILQDHKPTADEGGWIYPDDITGVTNFDITTQYQFAWIISLVNGENNQPGNDFSGKTVNILADLDMDESIWVPIGNERFPFMGTINGNGHLIENMHSSLVQNNMGMIGIAEDATIQDVMAAVSFNANSANMGSVAGTAKGETTISNVEAAGTITGGAATVNMGGLVGITQPITVDETTTKPTIHSSFAVNDLTGATNTVMGGLVGTNGGDLYNSFANITMTGATQMGGLVGENKANCHVENCYVNLGSMNIPAFAYTNKGIITYCYASKAGQYVAPTTEVEGNVAPTLSGTFGTVQERKHLDYMYRDNMVTAPEGNTYAHHEGIEYTQAKHAPLVWNGLLSVLNQWVDNTQVDGDFSSWNRPTTQGINGDLPILAFPMDNCVGNYADEDGKFLRYSASDEIEDDEQDNNGLDALLTHYSGKAANIYLYQSAVGVTNGSGNALLFIHEDAALLQDASSKADITATVGVTFDNSCRQAGDYIGNTLTYDWHFMSSALQDAPINATFGDPQGFMHDVNIESIDQNCYFPNGLPMTAGNTTGVKWDFYAYSEKDYHWINLKRNDHFYQESGQQLTYTNESGFIPGKGYMMAISQDSYMNSTGKLNNSTVSINLTNQEDLTPVYNKGWNLVGNPYQGYLDLQALLDDTDNKDNATQAYVYDADEKVYVPFVKKASDNPRIVQRYVHQHQGFFVHSEKENTTLTFKPSMATATIAQGYTAPYYRDSEERINYPLVNLFAENGRGNRDLAIVEFNRPELGGATKVNGLRNANFQLAASLEGHRYGLVFTPEGTEKVPVHFTTEEDGTFTLTWETLHGDFTSLLLVDNMTGTITDMLRADHYTFDASKDDYASRFYLTYTVTGVDEYNEGDGSFAFFDGSEWVVNGKGQLDIVDVTGRILFSKRLANEQNRVSLNGVANGVYLMRVTDGKNTMVQKIVVK